MSGALEIIARGYTYRNGSGLVGVENGREVAPQRRYAGANLTDLKTIAPAAGRDFAERFLAGRVLGAALEHVPLRC